MQKEPSNPEINEHDMPSSLNEGEIVLYTSDSGKVIVPVIYNVKIFWLAQKLISELFNKRVSTILRHISNIFDDQELDKKVICVFCKFQIHTNPRSEIHLRF